MSIMIDLMYETEMEEKIRFRRASPSGNNHYSERYNRKEKTTSEDTGERPSLQEGLSDRRKF